MLGAWSEVVDPIMSPWMSPSDPPAIYQCLDCCNRRCKCVNLNSAKTGLKGPVRKLTKPKLNVVVMLQGAAMSRLYRIL